MSIRHSYSSLKRGAVRQRLKACAGESQIWIPSKLSRKLGNLGHVALLRLRRGKKLLCHGVVAGLNERARAFQTLLITAASVASFPSAATTEFGWD